VSVVGYTPPRFNGVVKAVEHKIRAEAIPK